MVSAAHLLLGSTSSMPPYTSSQAPPTKQNGRGLQSNGLIRASNTEPLQSASRCPNPNKANLTMQHTTGPQNNHGISHSLPCTCLNETLDVKDLKAREQQLKKKETALKKQQLELQEQTEQLVLLKSLQNSTEEKLNNANEEIRLLKIKLLALEEVHANGSSQYFKQTHESESKSRNDLNDLCTKMATMAIANLANNMSNNAPSPQSAQCEHYSADRQVEIFCPFLSLFHHSNWLMKLHSYAYPGN